MADDSPVSTHPSDAIALARCRALLGREADALSDEEIDALRRHAEAMAHILIDLFLHDDATRRKNGGTR